MLKLQTKGKTSVEVVKEIELGGREYKYLTSMISPFFQHIFYIEQSHLDRMVQCH